VYRKSLFGGFLLVLLVASIGLALPPCDPPTIKAEVVRVIDGDTIEVKIIALTKPVEGLKTEANYRVRYIGIDAPEKDQAGYAEATQINKMLVEGRTVWLELDKTVFDKYGRLLAYVYLDPAGNFMVNLALVTSTLFRAYTFDDTPRYNDCFINADNCSACIQCVPASQAIQFVGKTVMVCGTVKSVRRLDYNRIFLNFERPYPDQLFTVMVEEDYAPYFDQAFGYRWENKLLNQRVCVFGTISLYQGVPEIKPTSPSQICSDALTLKVSCPSGCK
jgi:endonuclease YncB( thermonuclease family)